MILYLNKRDLFEEKIKEKNIRDIDVFSDYSGRDNNYDDGVQYFVVYQRIKVDLSVKFIIMSLVQRIQRMLAECLMHARK